MLSTHRRGLALVIMTAMAVASCSSSNGGATTGADDGPLSEYMGGVTFEMNGGMSISYGGDGDESFEATEEDLQRWRDIEEAVAACMRDEGFEYHANVQVDFDWSNSPWEVAHALPPDEFAEQYGYGISTLRFDDFEYPEDPNEEYRSSLSPEAQQAYEVALQGVWASPEGYDGWNGEEWVDPPIEDQGCYGLAYAELYGDEAEEEQFIDPWTEFEALFEDLYSIVERIRSDPRLEEPTTNWRDCMADAGFPEFENPGDPEQDMWQRMDELEGWDEFHEMAEDDDGDTAIAMEPSPIDPDDLRELQQHEIAVATADYTCLEEHYTEIFYQVQHEVEAEFVEQHKDELERYRDWTAENDMGGGGIGFGG